MSKGSSKPAYQTVTQVSSLPGWIEQGGADNYSLATSLASQPYQSYGGQRIADPSADLSASWQGVRDLQGTGAAAMQPGIDMAAAAGNYTPQQVTAGTNNSQIMPGLSPYLSGLSGGAPNIGSVGAGSFLSGNINAYMSPYTANVEKYALQNLDDQRLRSLNQTADQAISAGAFGGSRHGVMEGVVNAESAKNAGALSAQLRDQAFNTGAGLMTQDQNRALQAGMANQQTQLGSAQLGLQGMTAAGNLALAGLGQQSQIAENNLARSMQAQGLNQQAGLTASQNAVNASKVMLQGAQTGQQLSAQELAMLEAAGKGQTSLAQSQLDLGYQNFQEQQAYPLDMLNLRLSALGMTPYGKSQTTTSPTTSTNPWMTALGGASTGASIANALGQTGGMAMGISGLGGLLGLLSDENDKKDIQKLGKDPDTGLTMYAYRYKDAPASAPKVVGPMAQEVEKKMPGAVKKIGGHRVIARNFGFGKPMMMGA
jgi:hypothetical protein